jgi:hypothetical protein
MKRWQRRLRFKPELRRGLFRPTYLITLAYAKVALSS